MELYNILANWVGWPVVVAFLLVSGGYAYWAFKKHINFLKEKNDWLEKEVNNLKEYSPDVLAQRLANRLKILGDELERLHIDQEVSKEVIKFREFELAQVNKEIETLKNQLEKANKLLSGTDLLCPYCGAALETKEYFPEYGWINGREIEYEIVHIRYECGYELKEDEVIGNCSQNPIPL